MIRLSPKLNLPEKMAVDTAAKLAAKLVEETLKNTPSVVNRISGHLADAQGKGVRTFVLLNSAMDSDGLVSHEAVRASAALEIFHLATLVHDDVIDDADMRRGFDSVQKKFGKKQAVIAGDYLLCLAFSTISDIYKPYVDMLPSFSKAMGRVCLGELNQYKNNRNLDLSVWEYFRIISGKTAALFYLAAYAGAIIGGAKEKEAKDIAKYGQYVGMIFQIVDDCKDYEFSQEDALKPVNSDIGEGVVTLPLILAMMKEPAIRDSVKDVFSGGSDVASVIREVCRVGGTDSSRELALRYLKKAEQILSKLHNSSKQKALEGLLYKAYGAAHKF